MWAGVQEISRCENTTFCPKCSHTSPSLARGKCVNVNPATLGPVEVEQSCRHKRRLIRGAQDGPGEGLERAERALEWGNAVRTWWTLCGRAHGAIGANGEIGLLGLTLGPLRSPRAHCPRSMFVTRGEVDGEELEQPLSTLQSRRDGVSERPLVRGGPTWAVFCECAICVPRSRCCRRFESSAPPRRG